MATDIELLTALRDAARRKDGNACLDATEAMLSRLPVPKMLRLVHQEVQRRLPLFERHHPHIHWPRVWLDALATDSPGTLDESTPEVLEEAPGPGGNNFTESVRQLALAAAASDSAKCVSHAIEAIAGVIMAEATETGGTKYRDLWDLWFQDALTLGEHSYSWVLVKFNKDPDVIAVELAAWNRLADELAAALGVAG